MADVSKIDFGDGVQRNVKDVVSRSNFANEFSTSTAYAVGDFVTYNGVLYECTTAHSAGAWNSAHFTQTTCADAFSGGGSSVKKTRYTITASSWSASANADGFYTYTQALSPAVKSSPDVYVAGSTDSTQPTDAQRAQFGYVERCKVNGSTLTLYAKTKPTATFYIWIEGEKGTASGDIVGNVIKSNNKDIYSASETLTDKIWIDGREIYRKVIYFDSLTNGSTTKENAIPSGIYDVVNIYGVLVLSGRYYYSLPRVHASDSVHNVGVYADISTNKPSQSPGDVTIVSGSDKTNYTAYVIVEYTK